MLRSLETDQPHGPVLADVAIVGAGLAGLVLANSLTREGLSVVVIESGPAKPEEGVHPLNKVVQGGQEYIGAAEGRFRGLGGTSTRWGGALLPYLPNDLEEHPCGWHDGWGLGAAELEPFLPAIEEAFGVESGTYEGPQYQRFLSSFQPRLPKWPVFKNRSTANIYRHQIKSDSQITVWTDATVTNLKLGAGQVAGVIARGTGGKELEVAARHVAIAAGAIETTRLLLLFNRAYGGALFTPDSPLGKGFHDHLSAPVAKLATSDNAAVARLFGFHFVQGGMRNLRFELDAVARSEKRLPAAFLHVAFTYDADSGFDGLRRVYQAIQKGRRPGFADLADIARDLPWFLRAAWWRFVEKRVLPPSGSHFDLHLVTEQRPGAENTIGLSESATDAFGQPLARIDWKVHEGDIAYFHSVASLAIDEWANGPLAEIARLIPRDRVQVTEELAGCGGIYHPAGATRIGASASEGVVDSQLRVHGIPGLWAIATSVFPAVGGTSPSLGLTQFAARAAGQIATEVRKGV